MLLFIVFSIFQTVWCFTLVEIYTNNTIIFGRKLYTLFENKPYAAFWNIPYAEPPIDNLRFQPPKELTKPLNGSFHNFSEEPDSCPLVKEDCLYLSIFKPLQPKKLFPVLVWIHENSFGHDPDFFIDEEVIIVKVSYRTGILGFLNTGDDFAPGNMGAKDIIAALRWIRGHIGIFDGDPSKVTVAGSGPDGSIVASLLTSSKSDDLFSRLIVQSGSALIPNDLRISDVADKLFQKLTESVDKLDRMLLYEILRTVPIDQLQSITHLFDSTEVRDRQRNINAFGLTPELSSSAYYINKNPIDVYNSKMAIHDVQLMIGYTSLEMAFKLSDIEKERIVLKYLNDNFQYLLPFEGEKDAYLSKRYKQIRRQIKDFYFINGKMTEKSFRRYAKYLSDQIIYPIIRQARLQAGVSLGNVYLYRFNFNGKLNVGWNHYLTNVTMHDATLKDEICYLFKCKSMNEVYSTEASAETDLIRKLVKLWSNFIKSGNPNSDELTNIPKWEPLSPNKQVKVMNFGTNIKYMKAPEEKRFQFWEKLKEEYFVNVHDEL